MSDLLSALGQRGFDHLTITPCDRGWQVSIRRTGADGYSVHIKRNLTDAFQAAVGAVLAVSATDVPEGPAEPATGPDSGQDDDFKIEDLV